MTMTTLSLIVPVYKTADLVPGLVKDLPLLAGAAESCGCRLVETIVVDDGSPNPAAIAAALAPPAVVDPLPCPLRLIRHEKNRGKGQAIRTGALAAMGDLVLMSDADRSAPLMEFPKLFTALAPDVWIVCGSRRALGAFDRHVPLHRRGLSRLFNLLVRLAGIHGIHDTQCGFKLFRMSAMRAIFEAQRIERFAFDVELIARARAAGGRVVEVPVAWHGSSRSTLRVPRDAPRMLFDLACLACRRR